MTTSDECYEHAGYHAADLERICDLLARMREREGYRDESWEELIEKIEEEHLPDPLDITVQVEMSLGDFYAAERVTGDDVTRIEVLLGTGGPAYGITFNDYASASCWYQGWGTPKVYYSLDSDAASYLAERWGLFQ